MSNRFLTYTNGDISNGTLDIFGATIGANNLVPGLPIKADVSNRLESTLLDISDVSGLQSALNSSILNPLQSDLKCAHYQILDTKSIDIKTGTITGTATLVYNGASNTTLDVSLLDADVKFSGITPVSVSEVVLYNSTDGKQIKESGVQGNNIVLKSGSTMTGSLLLSDLDSVFPGPLGIGSNNAITINIGKLGNFLNVLSTLQVNNIESQAAGILTIAPFNSSGVNISRALAPVNIFSTITKIASTLDTITSVAMNIGPTLSSIINVGSGTCDTKIFGKLKFGGGTNPIYIQALDNDTISFVNPGFSQMLNFTSSTNIITSVTAHRFASTIDKSTASTLSIGTGLASAITIGSSGITTTVNGQLVYTRSYAFFGFAPTNATTTVITTIAVPVIVSGTYILSTANNFTIQGGNTLRYSGNLTQNFRVSLCGSIIKIGATSVTSRIGIYKNGVVDSLGLLELKVDSAVATYPVSFSTQSIYSLATNDVLSVQVANMTNADDYTIVCLSMSVTGV